MTIGFIEKLERSGYGIPRVKDCTGKHESVEQILKCKPCVAFLDRMDYSQEAPITLREYRKEAIGLVLAFLAVLVWAVFLIII